TELSAQLCGLDCNATCAEKVQHLPPAFSSTYALTLLGIVFVVIVMLSLTTHHCHKGKMKRRKMERAQEEYERDQRSPVPARGKPDSGRCTIIRPASKDAEARSASPASDSPAKQCTTPDDPSSTLPTVDEDMKGVEEAALEAVAVS
uniref:Si:dkey-183i3.9 n=1 Tax=Astyanax mexicanus TaxID=7994 RepID=A0A8B9JX50_ASTMX